MRNRSLLSSRVYKPSHLHSSSRGERKKSTIHSTVELSFHRTVQSFCLPFQTRISCSGLAWLKRRCYAFVSYAPTPAIWRTGTGTRIRTGTPSPRTDGKGWDERAMGTCRRHCACKLVVSCRVAWLLLHLGLQLRLWLWLSLRVLRVEGLRRTYLPRSGGRGRAKRVDCDWVPGEVGFEVDCGDHGCRGGEEDGLGGY